MIWVLVGATIAAIIFFMVRNKSVTDTLPNVRLRQQEAASLPELQKVSLASNVRELALTGYDRGRGKAKAEGKADRFAHEVGILDALYCVLANTNDARADPRVRVAMQMESVPFNNLEPQLGREAVAEYLVWKFFPDWADEEALSKAMREFIKVFFERVESESDPDGAIQQMIYSTNYDWQTLAAREAREVPGETNG